MNEKINETSKDILDYQFSYVNNVFKHIDSLNAVLKISLKDKGILFRPYFCRLGIELSKLNYYTFIEVLAGIEFIQKSTLVIDDILDASPYRNGVPSVYKKHGIKNAVLCGEILKNIGIKLIRESIIDSRIKLQIIDELEAAYFKIYEGQYLDVLYENHDIISEEEYFKMIYLTTGSFIESSLVCGLRIGNLSEEDINLFRLLGRKLGIAYQVRDDIVNLISDTSNGKILAEDLKEKKKRLPVIHFMNNSDEKSILVFNEIWLKQKLNDDDLYSLLSMLKNAGSINYSIDKLANLLKECNDIIKGLSKKYEISEFRELINLVGSL